MLKRISKETAFFELLAGNEKIYMKGVDVFMKAIDCTWRFRDYGGGYYFNKTMFYVEIEDEI